MTADHDELASLTKDAYVFAFPMIENYRTMWDQAVEENSGKYEAPFNTFAHMAELLGPDYTAVVAPNNDTLYSVAWLDLATEPVVLSLPDFGDRYFVTQLIDMYTHNIEYIGVRTTGSGGGRFVVAGPGWEGTIPDDVDGVRHSEGRFVMIIQRTAVDGPADAANVVALQNQFELVPLSSFAATPVPDAVPLPGFPRFDQDVASSIGFIGYFNFLLDHVEIHPSERELIDSFAAIGVGAGRPFDPSSLDGDVAAAIAEGIAAGQAAIDQARLEVGRMVNNWSLIGEGFGYRETMQGRYLARAGAASAGLYGNNPEEAFNFSGGLDSNDEPLNGSHRYVLRFDTAPPVDAFWSVTMYWLPKVLLVANPIDRYSISDRTPGFVTEPDGSLAIYLQHESPGPDLESNWLPAPEGPFVLGLRIYWPEQAVLDGSWTPAAVERID